MSCIACLKTTKQEEKEAFPRNLPIPFQVGVGELPFLIYNRLLHSCSHYS